MFGSVNVTSAESRVCGFGSFFESSIFSHRSLCNSLSSHYYILCTVVFMFDPLPPLHGIVNLLCSILTLVVLRSSTNSFLGLPRYLSFWHRKQTFLRYLVRMNQIYIWGTTDQLLMNQIFLMDILILFISLVLITYYMSTIISKPSAYRCFTIDTQQNFMSAQASGCLEYLLTNNSINKLENSKYILCKNTDETVNHWPRKTMRIRTTGWEG